MARISDKNDRFRTKKQISNDIVVILSAGVEYGTKFAVLSEVVWVWSEFYGKDEGCPWWSTGALKEQDQKKLICSWV